MVCIAIIVDTLDLVKCLLGNQSLEQFENSPPKNLSTGSARVMDRREARRGAGSVTGPGRRPLTPPGKSLGVPRAPGLSLPTGIGGRGAGSRRLACFRPVFPVTPRAAPEDRGSRPRVFSQRLYYKDSKNSPGVTTLIPW